tara:strand:+ start:21437 stop:22039 length:603 start_codon:yes stop_codon:yes gene_type:complete
MKAKIADASRSETAKIGQPKDSESEQWVALFYSVVISPTRRIKSADLIKIAEHADFRRARTVMSTGNLVGWARDDEAVVEQRLERAAEVIVGKRIPVLCRSVPNFRQILERNPIQLESPSQAQEVAIRIMRSQPATDVLERLASKVEKGDNFYLGDRALWLSSSNPLSKSRMMRAINASWVGVGTTRSLSSLLKIEKAIV